MSPPYAVAGLYITALTVSEKFTVESEVFNFQYVWQLDGLSAKSL